MTLSTTTRAAWPCVTVVLFDMDNTLVHATSPCQDDLFLGTLRELLCAAGKARDHVAADALICQHGESQRDDLMRCLPRLGISPRRYLQAVADRLRPHLAAFPDAVEAVIGLAKRGYRLAPATTNGRAACLVKLTIAGLADTEGSPYFPELFGGSEVSPNGKTGPAFYTALLKRLDVQPDEVLMVGDDPTADLAYARAAGISQIVLPRRSQTQPWVVENGGIFVQSLSLLLDWLPPRKSVQQAAVNPQ